MATLLAPLFLIVLFLPTALFAGAAPLGDLIEVVPAEQMPPFAMCFASIQGALVVATKNIDPRGDGLHMGGVDAGTVAAEMIELQSIGNGTNGVDVVCPMGERAPTANHHYPVSGARIRFSRPRPTFIRATLASFCGIDQINRHASARPRITVGKGDAPNNSDCATLTSALIFIAAQASGESDYRPPMNSVAGLVSGVLDSSHMTTTYSIAPLKARAA